MNTVPQELDWVSKRAACTAERIFFQLVAAIKEDVKARNVSGGDVQFVAELTGDQMTLVIGETGTWARKERVRIFALNGKIEVRDEIRGAKFAAKVFLNDEGRCQLKMQDETEEDGRELEQWQFRREALEGLFFGD